MLLCPVRIRTVSIHTPIQGVTLLLQLHLPSSLVSIHTPIQGVTLQAVLSDWAFQRFNPHTHTGCDCSRFPIWKWWWSFNPHTHTGCDRLDSLCCNEWLVSIHTPIQGVTLSGKQGFRLLLVSIHTPIQGVTQGGERPTSPHQCFNPHTHTGCDLTPADYFDGRIVSIHTPIQGVTSQQCKLIVLSQVSIHTPIQGVTYPDLQRFLKRLRFNPHTHTGCDCLLAMIRQQVACFNPHTHTGCDTVSAETLKLAISFNPHTHTGCDYSSPYTPLLYPVSIHTPIQGVTWRNAPMPFRSEVSIHTPIQGVTLLYLQRV